MAKKIEKQEKAQKTITTDDIIDSILEESPDDHFNFAEEVSYKVSSGSLKLDYEMGGGLKPGAHRFVGSNESGKTSAALSYAKNFQESVPNSKVILIKAEGRFSEEIRLRSGISVEPQKFRLIKSNVFEFVTDLMRALVMNNPEKKRFLFIIDSVDNMISKDDLQKSSTENNQPGTAGRKLAELFRKMSLALSELGHVAIFISQEKIPIEINPYAPKAQKQGKASGGSSLKHSADWALEFHQKNKSSLIFEGDNDKGKLLGHNCGITFIKSPNEKTFQQTSYPIRYGRTNGNSIWREREIVEYLLMFNNLVSEGKTFTWHKGDTTIYQSLKDKFGDKIPEKFVYRSSLDEFLDSNPDITNFIYESLRKSLL